LVITAAAGVQAFAGIADPGCQFCLNEHVDIFGIRVESEATRLDIGAYLAEPSNDRFDILRGEDADRTEHASMGLTAPNVLAVHPGIKGDR